MREQSQNLEQTRSSNGSDSQPLGLFKDAYDEQTMSEFQTVKDRIAMPNLTNSLPVLSLYDAKQMLASSETNPQIAQRGSEQARTAARVKPESAGERSPESASDGKPESASEGTAEFGAEVKPPVVPLTRKEGYSPLAGQGIETRVDAKPAPSPSVEPTTHSKRGPRNTEKPGSPEYYAREIQVGDSKEKIENAYKLGDSDDVVIDVNGKQVKARVDVNESGVDGVYYVHIYTEDGKIAYRGLYNSKTGEVTHQKDRKGNDVPYMSDAFDEKYGDGFTQGNTERRKK